MTSDTAARPDRLDRFLADIERRALVMAELATQDREDALDLVQDSLIAFVKGYSGKPESDWRPLFYRVLQNRIRDWYRRTQVRQRWRVWLRGDPQTSDGGDPIQTLADPGGILPEDKVDNQRVTAAVVQAMKALPERQRQAVLLRIWEELNVAETAVAMGCSAGSVKTHLSRGLTRLREHLEASR